MKKLLKNIIINLLPESVIFWRKRGCEKSVALTFDDGPNGHFTPKILGILKEVGVKATFFLVGGQIQNNAHCLKSIMDEGHGVGMHTFAHEEMRGNSGNFELDLDKCQSVFKQHGMEARFFRPPRGKLSLWQVISCLKRKIGIAMWSIDSGDYKFKDKKDVVAAILDNPELSAGAIILCHDDNQVIVDALPAIIAGIRARGLSFATLGEMFP